MGPLEGDCPGSTAVLCILPASASSTKPRRSETGSTTSAAANDTAFVNVDKEQRNHDAANRDGDLDRAEDGAGHVAEGQAGMGQHEGQQRGEGHPCEERGDVGEAAEIDEVEHREARQSQPEEHQSPSAARASA